MSAKTRTSEARTPLTTLQARKAVKAVKLAKSLRLGSRRVSSGPKRGKPLTESALRRYLGHFGVGTTTTVSKGMANK